MSREEALSILKFTICEVYDQVFYDYDAHDFEKDEYEALNIAIDALKQPTAQQWIPCSERLPEYKQEIFFTEKNNETGELYVGRGQFWGVTARTGSRSNPWYYADTFGADGRRWHVLDSKIVAWLPVPQPWKGDSNEQIH